MSRFQLITTWHVAPLLSMAGLKVSHGKWLINVGLWLTHGIVTHGLWLIS